MKPVYQTQSHNPEQGQFGDCFRAMIASALELPIEDVPHFLRECEGEPLTWRRGINAFLRSYNLAFINIGNSPTWMRDHGITGLMHEVIGETQHDTLHSILAIDGEPIHDPFPNGLPMKKLDENWGVFIVLDPSKPVGRAAAGDSPAEYSAPVIVCRDRDGECPDPAKCRAEGCPHKDNPR